MFRCLLLRLVKLVILLLSFSQFVSAQKDEPYMVYGNVPWKIERNNLDNFANELRFDKDTIGFIVYRPSKKDCILNVKSRIDRAVRYLTTQQKISKNRIVTLYAGQFDILTIHLRLIPKEELKENNLDTNYKQKLDDYVKADDNCKAARPRVKRKKAL